MEYGFITKLISHARCNSKSQSRFFGSERRELLLTLQIRSDYEISQQPLTITCVHTSLLLLCRQDVSVWGTVDRKQSITSGEYLALPDLHQLVGDLQKVLPTVCGEHNHNDYIWVVN